MSNESFEFSNTNLKKYKEILPKYDDRLSAVLPVLHLAQEQHGYLPDVVLKKLSEMMEIPLIHFKEVVSFYDMFYAMPTAKNIIQVCTNITCSMFGAREIYQGILDYFNTKNLGSDIDGKYFFQKMECLGACSDAPCMRLNNDYQSRVSLNKAIDLIEDLP